MIDRFRLEVLAALAESGSFSAAARELGISQPAVSQNIAELEKYAGARLFSRSRGGVVLTEKGSVFLRRAEAVLAAYVELESCCKASQSILLKGVTLDGRSRDVLVDRGLIADLDVQGEAHPDKSVDALGLEMLPSYFDAFCSDPDRLPLCLRDGCGFVSFTPADQDSASARIEGLGIRAALAVSPEDRELLRGWGNLESEMLSLIVDIPSGCSGESLCKVFAFARKRGFRLRCPAGGGTVKYLDSLHLLGSDLFLYGCSLLGEEEWRLCARRRVNIIHCPTTDYRGSGVRFPYESALASGCRMLLGTGDSHHGIAEEMRTARLLSSVGGKAVDMAVLRNWATVNAAEAFGAGLTHFSRGCEADFILAYCGVDIAEASNIRHLFCNGRIVYSAPCGE